MWEKHCKQLLIRNKALISAVFLSFIFLLLYLTFGQIRHGSLDDYFMSSVLTGAYGSAYDVHTYFVNAAYGIFLKPFYVLFPKVGWYFLFELAGTFCAFTTFAYLVIHRLGSKYGIIVSAILLAALTPDFYFQLSFTQCATIYTAAGIVSFTCGYSENKKRFLIIGGLFLLAGSIMRFEGMLLGLPFFALLLLFLSHEKRRFPLIMTVSLCITFSTIWIVKQYDRSLYSEGEYKYYANYQPIRAYFGDGAFYDNESTFDELEEREMSGMDFYQLKGWMFYDTEVFQIDSLLPIKNVAQNNLYKPNPKRMVATFFLSVSKALMQCSGWCWVLVCSLLMLSSSKKANLYPWASMCLIAVSIGYLLLVNRLVYHVESGVWLYAIVSAIPFMNKVNFIENRGVLINEKILSFGSILLVIFFTYIGVSNQESLKRHLSLIETPEIPKEWVDFLNYAETHRNDVFLLSFNRYKELGTFKNPAYRTVEPGSWDNIFSLGYWNIHLPSMKNELKKRDVNNPIRDIVHDNVYVLEDPNGPELNLFYSVHYHKPVTVDTIQKFGELKLFKYRVPEDSL